MSSKQTKESLVIILDEWFAHYLLKKTDLKEEEEKEAQRKAILLYTKIYKKCDRIAISSKLYKKISNFYSKIKPYSTLLPNTRSKQNIGNNR
ncbi:MAG: hypothetical protein N2169_06635 [bacterium]|nr:hypothetical protein [bacterium]